MAAPDQDQTKEALERVEREGREPGLGEVVWHELDLKDPRTAKASAQSFMEKEKRLDILSWFLLLLPFTNCSDSESSSQQCCVVCLFYPSSSTFLITCSVSESPTLESPPGTKMESRITWQ